MGAVYLEGTEVPDSRTVMEIQDLLARKGATSIQIEYSNGRVNSLSFRLNVNGQSVPFRLPCRWEAVEKILRNIGKKLRKNDTYADWARRVAWRQIYRWIQAQLALVDTNMVRPEEVFLPYAMVGLEGEAAKTLYDVIAERKFLSLPGPKEDPKEEGEGS
jgi:hypothetical protein